MSESNVYMIRVPNPFVEGRTCVYVIDSDPVTMIDTGVATDRAYDALLTGLDENGLKPSDIKRIILTHKHIDHIGNAWRFQQQFRSEIMIHDADLRSVVDVDPSGERYAALVSSRLDEWNVPNGERPSDLDDSFPKWMIESAEATGLGDEQQLPMGDGHLEIIHTPGHTMGSICLKFGRYLFSGDHVLPDISPNIGAGDMRSEDLLSHYMVSLKKTRDRFRDDDLQVMPGHGLPMQTMTQRCEELIGHHEQRLEDAVLILRQHGNQSIYEVACRLFGEMESIHVVLGCAEAKAHLDFLVEQERAKVEGCKYAPA